MRVFLWGIVTLLSSFAWSATKGQYLGRQMIVNITSQDRSGAIDESPGALFAAMDRPVQNSFLGKGKSLIAPQNQLNFICAEKSANNYQCSIYIHQSNFGKIAPGKAQYRVTGAEAQALFAQFHSNGAQFSFRDENQTFAVEATPDQFLIVFAESGL
ncbi:MAG: hypothetical protein HUU57_13520 [Bdellovibrio sp.]|nr:hypothetical protein [Bdellovibrio sp.]